MFDSTAWGNGKRKNLFLLVPVSCSLWNGRECSCICMGAWLYCNQAVKSATKKLVTER